MRAFITADATVVIEADCECDNANCEAYLFIEMDDLKRTKIEPIIPDEPGYEDEHIVLEKDTMKKLIGFIDIFLGESE